MTYQELVEQVRLAYKNADASSVKEHIAFQFNIQGEGEGAFYLEIADGKINIEPYEYYDRDAIITTTAETLLKIGTGKLDPVLAFTIGKIKVEGNLDKALVLKSISKKVEVSEDAKTAMNPAAAMNPVMAENPAAAMNPAVEENPVAAETPAAADKPKGGDSAGKWPNRNKKKRR